MDQDQGARSLLRRLVFAVDVAVALSWLLAPSSAWESHPYKPARVLFGFLPADWRLRPIGALLLLTSAIIWLTGESHRELYYAVGSLQVGFWTFWAVLFGYAAVTDASHQGVIGPFLCLFVAGCHQVLLRTSSRSP